MSNLVKHGILNEQSHYRVHVSGTEKRAYIFETDEAYELATSGRYRTAKAYINSQHSATGVLVPVSHMTTASCVDIPFIMWIKNRMKSRNGEVLGNGSENIVAELFANNYFPHIGNSVIQYFWDDGEYSQEMQLSGVDMTVNGWNVEVKYDGKCGVSKESSGNFFIQTHEKRVY